MNKKITINNGLDDESACQKLLALNSREKSAKIFGLAVSVALASCLSLFSQTGQAAFNIPTNSTSSPLCMAGRTGSQCATAFTQKLLMFEEFGLQKLDDRNSGSSNTDSHLAFPAPGTCQGTPAGADLDAFLKASIFPYPNERSDVSDEIDPVTNLHIPSLESNPWHSLITGNDPVTGINLSPPCVSGVTHTVNDGRPGGMEFAHQRWAEFFPVTYFQSAMTGARINGGLRDDYQMHKYNKGEFGPGGLYYNTVYSPSDPALDPAFNGTTKNIPIKMHSNLPTQDPLSVWTFDGTLPPKLLMARYGESILFRHYNALPVDVAANKGFGRNTITTHEHNGHNPAESDGFAHAYSYPGEFYDYHWPMQLAGYDSINTSMDDSRTGAPDDNGGIKKVRGDWHETMSTHWFHDHMLDYTAQNVYKGNAAMMNYYSAIDRGREPKDLGEVNLDSSKPGYGCHYANPNNVNLCFPSGSGLDWGNRDYDVNLVVADKAWDNSGQLKFNIFNTDGFLGDRITVNWIYKPFMDVRARRYRFRILNGSVSRYYKIAIVDETGKAVPSYMIANDGNILKYTVPFPNPSSASSALPEQGIAERYDIIVDFKGFEGKKLYFVNVLEHVNGLGPNKVIPLTDAFLAGTSTGKYKPDGINGDPVIGKFMEFRVNGCVDNNGIALASCPDFSMDPAKYVEGNVGDKQMIPPNRPTTAEMQAAVHHTFDFGKSNGTDLAPWTIKTDGSAGLNMDPHRISAATDLTPGANGLGKVQIWHINLGGNGWSHPVHVHFEEGQILYRGGKAPPPWEKFARKDVYRVGPIADSLSSVDMAIRVREFAGTYVEHCHNTQHEDKAMLLRWDSEKPGQTIGIPTPMPEWDGVDYAPSVYLPKAKTGDTAVKSAFKLPPAP
jgi:manganese oxidase